MSNSRRLPVYILHDGSEAAVHGITTLIDHLRCDPQSLETVWLSFISLAGAAKQTVPLTDLCAIGNVDVTSEGAGAPDVDGGLCLFEADVQKSLRKTTSTTKGDWRPILVLFVGADPQGELKRGIDVIRERRCGHRLAFVGSGVSPLPRARLIDGGFELFEVVDGLVKPGSWSDTNLPWGAVLAKAITAPYLWNAIPPPMELPPPVSLDDQGKPMVKFESDVASWTSDQGDKARPEAPELKTNNIFTADLGKLSTDGRLTRLGLLGYFLLYFALIVLSVLVGYFSMTLSSIVSMVALGIFLIGLIKRAHDVGLSGWFILVPFLGFWLFVAPGERDENRFGKNPRTPAKG